MLQKRLNAQNLVYWPVVSGKENVSMTNASAQNTLDSARWKQHMSAVATQNDRSAYKALYLHFAPKIKSFYLQQGLTKHAEELTHEVFIKVWQKAASYNPEKANVSTWIFTIVRNLRIDYLRRKRITEVNEEETEEAGEEADLMASVQTERNKMRLNDVFELLNNEQRNVLQKVYFEDKSHQIAAQELEMTIGVVKSRIRSALKILRSHLGGEEP